MSANLNAISYAASQLREHAEIALNNGHDPLDCFKAALSGWGKSWNELSFTQRLMIENACKAMTRVERWAPVTEVQT